MPAQQSPQSSSLADAVAKSGKPLMVYVDGACRGNPGLSGAGWVFCLQEGAALGEGCLYLGHHTNNEAEYLAAALGLTAAYDMGVKRVLLRADSELMVRQVQGAYQVKNTRLRPLYTRLMSIAAQFEQFAIEHVLRGRNSLADAMANRAIDARPRL